MSSASTDPRARAALRDLLRRTGLLPLARTGRGWARRARYLPHNLSYWRGDREPLPVPPLALIDLVSGQPDIPWFLEGGRRGAGTIRDALQRQGTAMADLHRVLDFGCGCGRVLRHWFDLAGQVEVHGSDVNGRLVEWVHNNLNFARADTNDLAPPLAYADDSFDLVYAFSVFTHLPEALQRPWIEELHRVTAPAGFVALSTHGQRYVGELDADERTRFERGGLVVRAVEDAGSNACGAYHPESYVRADLAHPFEVVEHVPEGARGNPHQDLWLLQKGA